MNIRSAILTTEFWIGLATAVIMAVFPDFPQEAAIALFGWVAMRAAQKSFGLEGVDGKRAWQTSEFYVSIGVAIAKTLFPEIPPETIYAVLGIVGLRTGVKVTTGVKAIK